MLEGVFAPDQQTGLPRTNGYVCVIDSSTAEKCVQAFLCIHYTVHGVPLQMDSPMYPAQCFELDICAKINSYYRPSSNVRTASHLKLNINTKLLSTIYIKSAIVYNVRRIAFSANTKLWGLCSTSSLPRCILAPLSKFIFGFTFAHLLSASCQRLNY